VALRHRKLISISGKYPGSIIGFLHNQKVETRSIYYKDGVILELCATVRFRTLVCRNEQSEEENRSGQAGFILIYQ
jgi:hypothetical protein